MLHICLIFHASRSTNLGVGALTVAQIDLLRDICRRIGVTPRITLLDWHDAGQSCVAGDDIEVVRLSGPDLVRPSGAWRHIRAADIVVDIGAGDSFADIYGGRRLRRIFLLKYLTHLAGRPLVVAPQTLGPFGRRSSRFLAKLSLRLSKLIFARDAASAAHLEKIGFTREVGVASDVALRLKPAGHFGKPGGLAVGINVSGLLMSGGYTGANQFGLNVDYPLLTRQMIRQFLEHPDAPDVHLIPHVICPDRPVEDDMAAINDLAREFPDVVVAPAFATPSEAKGYIAQMSFMTGARMHACIAAFSSGVAVVPLAYSRKFVGLFGALGYDHVADCRTHLDEEVLACVMDGYANRAVLARDAKVALSIGLDRLAGYEAALEAVMWELAAAKEKPDTQGAPGLVRST